MDEAKALKEARALAAEQYAEDLERLGKMTPEEQAHIASASMLAPDADDG